MRSRGIARNSRSVLCSLPSTMFADTDIAARTIWLRNGANCAPRMDAATRWTLRVSACALRQTLSFLKSLMSKGRATNGLRHSVSLYAEPFYPKISTRTCPAPFSAQREANSGQRAAAYFAVSVQFISCTNPTNRQRAAASFSDSVRFVAARWRHGDRRAAVNACYFGAPSITWNGPSPCSWITEAACAVLPPKCACFGGM